MTERGMIFNGEMVRAILDGRKTQTRRIVKLQPDEDGLAKVTNGPWVDTSERNYRCPFGDVGDRIWVRETFQGPLFDYEQMEAYLEDSSRFEKPEFCQYAADGGHRPEYQDADDNLRHGWRPSIHMPRWASRIMLEITDVRVERLNAISEEDARAEGIIDGGCLNCGEPEPCGCANPEPDATDAFAYLWQSIYGQESWNANPWVWVLEFKRVEGGAA
ncbi:TPA: morphogenetic protein [Klebsiella pneumoniae]|nr:morphogenetic protein [Klebsiella pneumoniae]HEB5773709.1 morphogenetic protein [Klebsiella pneumoniae]HEB9057130.1 morphogenetic protein [Klebsiella pneumoniae]HEB9063246.1 morphogenetic protein [Klebsiella pneumoniae]HEB9078471.1 morphogenetic protein [Klebsiella pneumoniae]